MALKWLRGKKNILPINGRELRLTPADKAEFGNMVRSKENASGRSVLANMMWKDRNRGKTLRWTGAKPKPVKTPVVDAIIGRY